MGTNAKFRDLAIRTLIGEAARGDTNSMISVAHVIKNRADSGAWGDAAQGGAGRVILAPKQFSMWNADIPSSGKTISSSDPLYQRAGAIVDGVFNGQIPDNTGGATHYYAPSGMKGGQAPSWAVGQTPTATIGGQHFYKIGFNAANTAGTAVVSPSTVGQGASTPTAAPAAASGQFGPNDVYKNIPVKDDQGRDQIPMFMRWNPDPVGNDAKNLAAVDPALQRVIARARTENPGLSFVIGNGRRSVQDQDQAKAWGWSKVGSQDGGDANVHMNGRALDLWGLDKEGHVQFDPAQQQQISAAMQKAAQEEGVPMNWGGNFKSFKDAPHFELAGKGSAEASGAPEGPAITAPAGQGGIGSDAAKPLGTAPAGTPPAVSTIVPNPNVPAANAQPMSATTQNPSAGFVGPGSDKYSVIQGMTTGVGRNPQLTTAANWGNLFGGASAAPPAAAPAAGAPSAQPASAPATPAAPAVSNAWNQRPSGVPDAAVSIPLGGGAGRGIRIDDNTAPPGSPLASILPNWGQTTGDYDPDQHPGWAPNPKLPGALGALATTAGQPTLGFPAMTNPFGQPPPDQQVSQLPGSMFASAQNLIKYLFPSATG